MVGEVSYPIGNLLGIEYDGWTSSESGRTIFGIKGGARDRLKLFLEIPLLKAGKTGRLCGSIPDLCGGGGNFTAGNKKETIPI